MEKFEIYEIPFIYQETKLDPNPVYKIRPVLVLGNDILVPVAKITGTISDKSKIYLIKDWQQAGLSKPSVIDFNRKELERRDTIQNSKYIGKLSDRDIQSIKSQRLAEDFDPFDTYSLQDKIYDFLYFLIDDMDYEEMISEVSDEFGMSPDEAEKYVKAYINDSEVEWHDTADLEEDYTKADDEWGNPYTLDEVFDQLKELTNDFTDKDGTVRCWYEQEKIYGVKVLKKYYDVVEVSDGRMSNEEDMSWVIAYSDPKETKKKR